MRFQFRNLGVFCALLFFGCTPTERTVSSVAENPRLSSEVPLPPPEIDENCDDLIGSPWIPPLPVDPPSSKEGMTTEEVILLESKPITGYSEAFKTIDFSFSIAPGSDQKALGTNGSFTLVAELLHFPPSLPGGADPILVSLTGPSSNGQRVEYIQLSQNCFESGFVDSSCVIGSESVYQGTRDWLSHQIFTYNYMSVNSFPNCNWEGDDGNGNLSCKFNQSIFTPEGHLPAGSYTAQFVLLHDTMEKVEDQNASIRVSLIKKRDIQPELSGAIDLNLVLVGCHNVAASRTESGKKNLNQLISRVHSHFSQAGSKINLGNINSVEWSSARGGNQFAQIDYFNALEVTSLFKDGAFLPGMNPDALNVYLIDAINASSSSSNFTVLGFSSAILGPPISGTQASGLVFSTFNQLETFQSGCPPEAMCADVQAEDGFIEFAETMSHEMGHYLGLHHLAEREPVTDSSGAIVFHPHDPVADTPQCFLDPPSHPKFIYQSSCIRTISQCEMACEQEVLENFPGLPNPSYLPSLGRVCPQTKECQFNHIMWWTTKNSEPGNPEVRDGALFSPQSGKILNYSPFVR